MTNDPRRDAALALHRFGLGPRPGSIAAIASDPRGALVAELERPGAGRIYDPELKTSAQASRIAFEARAARQAQRIVAERAQKEAEQLKAQGQAVGEDAAPAATPPMQPSPTQPSLPLRRHGRPAPPSSGRSSWRRSRRASTPRYGAEIGFAERLVWFWSNHFCVSADKVPSMAGGYEREAIRPHVARPLRRHAARGRGPSGDAGLSRQRRVDRARTRSPASIAPAGSTRTSRARSWSCIRSACAPAIPRTTSSSFANVLTGWTIISDRRQSRARRGVHLQSAPARARTADACSARPMPTTASSRAARCSPTLPRHPATATHIATKLVRHFVADEPPPALVERLASVFRDTDGDLKEIAKALVTRREAWASAAAASSSGRANGWWRWCAPPARAGRSRAFRAWPGAARRAAVAAAVAQRLSPTTRLPGSTASASGSTSPTISPSGSPSRIDPREIVDDRARTARLGRDPAGGRPRREPASRR